MATIQNLNRVHISEEAHTKVAEAIAKLETELTPFLVNLSPAERRKYGSINEQNKLFVNKTYDYAQNQSALCSSDVDWAEFVLDYSNRARIESYLAKLNKLVDGLINAKTLADFDNFQAALDDYAYTGYKIQTGTQGFAAKYRDLKQFFIRSTVNPPSPSVSE